MNGMNAATGKPLSGLAHLRQRLTDILTTPIGTRVRRRDYGSNIFELVDRPMNPSTMIALIHATAEAIARWEPEFRLSKVYLDLSRPGNVLLNIEGTDLVSGQPVRIDGVRLA